MAAGSKKTTGTKRATATKPRIAAKRPAGTEQAKPTARGAKTMPASVKATRGARATPVAPPPVLAASGDEDDLMRLRESTKATFEKLHDIDPATLPENRREEYWRDRHIAREAWEQAENAAFENLVEKQKQQLTAVSASNAKLAKDVQTTATILGVLDVVSASLGILASVIALLA